MNDMHDSDKKFNLPEEEEKILKFWEENRIFEKSLEKTKKGKPFVFYEGPPTANAAPGIHHVEARAFKDIIPRYKTMRGFYVQRKAGWDTHGLPVEIQIEKELGFKTKQDIEKYGIAKFNSRAKESVWRHKEEWEKLTKRIAFWLDMEHPYITYEVSYMETLWWIIKEFWKKGLLKEDFKVVPWCPRCQTALSTHELGQPGAYKQVEEKSIFVTLKLKKPVGSGSSDREFLLIWTTTPWTLPANVAVAVNQKIEYTKFRVNHGGNEIFLWSATTPPFEKGNEPEIIERIAGKALVGAKYEPLFEVSEKLSLGGAIPYEVIAGDFVSTEEGTGMVHLAPAYGDEDMKAVKNRWGQSYPIIHTVELDGTVKKGISGISGGQSINDANTCIISALEGGNTVTKGTLYKVLQIKHDYPHCWRCDTPLLYFAKNSWWVMTTSVKNKLILNNEKINWNPPHLKHGRFGEFLRELRDWSFSRERYWGTPIPVWKCGKCGKEEVLGSREDLSRLSGGTRNKYFAMRHGESTSNIKGIAAARDGIHHLTIRGRTQVEKAEKEIKKKKIDLIFASDVVRTRETAEIIARLLGVKKIIFDKRLWEINVGIFEGKPVKNYHDYYSSDIEKFTKRPPEGESLTDLRSRMVSFLDRLEKTYSGKNILLVSHEYPIWMLYAGAYGLSNEEAILARAGGRKTDFIKFAEVLKIPYRNLPRDEFGEINLHRPYIDNFLLVCPKCAGKMQRVKEVADVWFDSGSMPFAQSHWPFTQIKNLKSKSKNFDKLLYPADYISEAVDQTRGWFYTLLAVSTLLGRQAPYKNVVSLGHVLDKNGQKMSKSKGNIVNPWEMIQKYGADTLRWYFYSINSPGEPKRFDEKDLGNKLRGFLMTLWNSFMLFDTYVDKVTPRQARSINKILPEPSRRHALDQWILAKLNLLINEVTKKLDKYDITSAARALEEFTISDFSQWYLRRSRSRLQRPKSQKEKDEAAMTIAHVLLTLSKISAPFIPFLSEEIYQRLRQKTSLKDLSVHLTAWPTKESRIKNQESRIFQDMQEVRNIVAEALKLRAEAGIKVRQPLQKLKIKNEKLKILDKELLELVKDETNVKEIIFDGNTKNEFELDIKITPELKEEGMVREVIRNIQEMRKDLGLKPKDAIKLQISSDSKTDAILLKWKKLITSLAGVRIFTVGGKKVFKIEREVMFEEKIVWLGIS